MILMNHFRHFSSGNLLKKYDVPLLFFGFLSLFDFRVSFPKESSGMTPNKGTAYSFLSSMLIYSSFGAEQMELFEALRVKIIQTQDDWYPSSDAELFKEPDYQRPNPTESLKETRQPSKSSFFSSFFGSHKSDMSSPRHFSNQAHSGSTQKKAGPQGIYLHGAPGCGKTFMMDIFYQEIGIENKKRVHYNEFMLSTHHRMHLLRVLPVSLLLTRSVGSIVVFSWGSFDQCRSRDLK